VGIVSAVTGLIATKGGTVLEAPSTAISIRHASSCAPRSSPIPYRRDSDLETWQPHSNR
jgi:hypothetical protein